MKKVALIIISLFILVGCSTLQRVERPKFDPIFIGNVITDENGKAIKILDWYSLASYADEGSIWELGDGDDILIVTNTCQTQGIDFWRLEKGFVEYPEEWIPRPLLKLVDYLYEDRVQIIVQKRKDGYTAVYFRIWGDWYGIDANQPRIDFNSGDEPELSNHFENGGVIT